MSLDHAVSVARERLKRMHIDAGVGHFGGNLSCIDSLVVLFNSALGQDDEFVLSKGHSSGALYVALWSAGLIADKELSTFHADGTRLAGHPPAQGLPRLRFATGSLGHGLSLSAGISLGKRLSQNHGTVFCLTSDGEWQEGSTLEAAVFIASKSLPVHILVDANGWQGFGAVSAVQPTFSVRKFMESLGADVREVDGHSVDELQEALGIVVDRPVVTILRTVKGKGWPEFEDSLDSHYLPPVEGAGQNAE